MKSILAFASVALVAALFFVAPALGVIVVGVTMLIFAPEIAAGARAVLAGLRTREARIVGAIAAIAAAVSAVFAIGAGAAFAAPMSCGSFPCDDLVLRIADTASSPAPAAITIPWGDWLGSLLAGVATLFVAFLTRAVAMAPAVVRSFLTNDVIAKAVDYAIATTRDAVHGQTVSVPVSNQLIAAALTWVVDNEPKIAGWADDKLRPMIVAQLAARGMIPAEASDANLAVAAPAPASGV